MASDVAKATAAAEKKDERAEQQAEKTDAAVTNDLAKDVDKANEKEVRAAADDAVTQAEGENKIALAKCEALAGDAQKACKDQANAELDMVKQRAKALKSDAAELAQRAPRRLASTAGPRCADPPNLAWRLQQLLDRLRDARPDPAPGGPSAATGHRSLPCWFRCGCSGL